MKSERTGTWLKCAFWLGTAVGGLAGTANAECWNLPAVLNDSNTTIGFEVDSTWHLVEGTTTGIAGRGWLENPNDYTSVHLEVTLPVAAFQTGNGARDERMREVMQAAEYPSVTFKATRIGNQCDPKVLVEGQPCAFLLAGNVTIHGITRELQIPSSVTGSHGDYSVSGETSFRWADFGIEDPSILIATLDPVVKIRFRIQLAHTVNQKVGSDAKHS